MVEKLGVWTHQHDQRANDYEGAIAAFLEEVEMMWPKDYELSMVCDPLRDVLAKYNGENND